MKPAQVLEALALRYCRPEWFLFREATFEGRRMDALAVGVFRSRGHLMLGFEVKVARADWRRELEQPGKAEPLWGLVDAWYVAAPRGVVPLEELPHDWGLLEVGEDLTVTAPRRAGARTPGSRRPPATRSLRPKGTAVERAVLIRLLLKLEEAGLADVAAVRAEVAAGEAARLVELREEARADVLREAGGAARDLERLAEDVALFEAASGVRVRDLDRWTGRDPERTGAALRALLALELDRRRADAAGRTAKALLEAAEALGAALDALLPPPTAEPPPA